MESHQPPGQSGHPKVMTVSYGTFSCTLEGFDDPFTTMQLVAEYFRKLAAEDRYFGGEPLQPDANLLHKIASDANPYKVDAELTDTGVTLRKATVVDAPDDAEGVVQDAEAGQDAATALFSSARGPAAEPAFSSRRAEPGTNQSDDEDGDWDGNDAEDSDQSLVAAAVFSTRRGPLTAGPDEPAQSAAAVLAAAEAEEDDHYDETDTVAAVVAGLEIPPPAEIIGAVVEDVADDSLDNVVEVSVEAPITEGANTAPADATEKVVIEDRAADTEPVEDAADMTPAEVSDAPKSDGPVIRDPEAAADADEAAAIAASVAASMPDAEADAGPQRSTAEDIAREEEALERLLETTNSKLEQPQVQRRTNALDRLKAAVAATEAERRLRARPVQPDEKLATADETAKVDPADFRKKMQEVRSDHEEVVAFSRPTVKGGTKRPRGTIATLILGKEQRVEPDAAEAAAPEKKFVADSDGAAPAAAPSPRAPNRAGAEPGPKPTLKIVRDEPALVRPDNAIGSDEAGDLPTAGFAAFADQAGASTLHELLEASAAYLSIVEGQARYSQAAILDNLAEHLAREPVNADATQRSLTQLMRSGRLLRVKADSYTLSKSARVGYEERLVS